MNEVIMKDIVIDILKESFDKANITPETTIEELGADSLDMVELMMKLEEKTGKTIEDSKVDELKTVQDIINLVE